MLRHVTVALLVVVSILIGALAWLRQTDAAYRIGQLIPLGMGLSVDLAEVEVPAGRCSLVRVTSENCAYCDKDQPQYSRLIAKAQQTQCSVVVVGPSVGDITTPAPYATVSLQYIDFPLGRELMPFLTPQTLLVDRSRRLVWQRQGALDDADLDAASRAIGRLQ